MMCCIWNKEILLTCPFRLSSGRKSPVKLLKENIQISNCDRLSTCRAQHQRYVHVHVIFLCSIYQTYSLYFQRYRIRWDQGHFLDFSKNCKGGEASANTYMLMFQAERLIDKQLNGHSHTIIISTQVIK